MILTVLLVIVIVLIVVVSAKVTSRQADCMRALDRVATAKNPPVERLKSIDSEER